MQTEETKPNYLRKTARVLLKIVLFIILFVVVLFLLILTPPVQKFATSKVESYLQNKLKTKVEIGSISFGLTGRINLKDIYIEDQTKDTLLSGGLISANLTIRKLFSNEVEVKELSLEDITAKIKRVLPDTAFNFQFIADAFITESTKSPDTAQTAPLKLDVYHLNLNNVNLVFRDVITGNDMYAHIGDLTARIDTLNPYQSHFSLPSLDGSNIVARIKQFKPLVEPKPLATDIAEAAQPITMQLSFGTIDLSKMDIEYANDVSDFYTKLKVGKLKTTGKKIDLQNNFLHLGDLNLENTLADVHLGKSEQAKVVKKEANQKVEAQAQNNWNVRIDNIVLNNNSIEYDDDNQPKTSKGIDFAHFRGDSLTLHAQDFVMNTDSIGTQITKGYFKEKSGFELDALEGSILYASNQTYLKDFYVKTPGTELKRNVLLTYSSYKALTDSLEKVQLDVDIPDSHVQVKDILAFAPQLRSQPAFSNPNEVWHMNIQASGNMQRLHIAALQFDGLKDTRINADGTLANLTNPNAVGGTLNIRRFHTSQSDIALFTGQRLSTAQINIPETFDIRGTVQGNAGKLAANLNVATSAGDLAVNGNFSNLTNPNTARYSANVRTDGLQLGSIMKDPATYGSVSANVTVNGQGLMPDKMQTTFKGNIYNFGYNKYNYRNIALSGSLRQSNFNVVVNSKDPNAYLNLTAKGNYNKPSFQVNGFVDSLKTLPLHFTTQPLVFRGKIDADVPSINQDNIEANVLVTQALFVSGTDRLPLDTMHLVSGRNDTAQYIRLNSDIANAELIGRYRISELGSIIQNNIEPYFSVTPSSSAINVQPYNFSFTADLVYSPILSGFLPGLKNAEPIHTSGRLATGQGLQAKINAPYILYSGNEISNANINVHTGDSLYVNGTIDHLKSGSVNFYHTRLNATALNNVIDFGLRIGDKADRDKYVLGGIITQPSAGNYSLSLRPDNLLLNYESWTAPPGNSIAFINNQIIANNFALQKGNQQLQLQSGAGTTDRPLNVTFNNFQLATISGFISSDSIFVNGLMNGTVTLHNLMQQPVFTSDLSINNLSFMQDTLGNVTAQVSSAGNRYNTNIVINGFGNDVALTGSFAPEGSNDIALDLSLAIRQLQLGTLEGILSGFVKQAAGAINGNVSINGTANKPKIQGAIHFNNDSITTVMLGGPFIINDEQLKVTENGFVFDNFSIRDSASNALTLNGNVQTTNFINYNFGLDVNARNFRALNTTKKDSKIYYGQIFLNTNLHIGGTEVKPIVDGSITINDGTNLTVVVPQPEPGVQEREGVVEFIDFDAPGNDSLFLTYDSLNVSQLMGFDISTNLTINKGAIFNIIVDETNGDFLNIQGSGELSAGIDPSGKVTLTGTYELQDGYYQLSFNFLQRRFDIQKGSKITWTGEPTSANINVTAVYIANTAPLDLVENQIEQTQRNYYLQKLPFQVQLNLTGELFKPQVDFNILLPSDRNYNVGSDIISTVNLKLTQLRQEPSELNKQVFAILLLNRFVGDNPFASSGGGFNAGSYARQSVSKLLTEQLNSLASGLIQGVDLNFDVASSDDYTTGSRRNRTDLNVSVSKRLLNDRLTVSVGNNFELEGPQQSNQKSNNIAGNVAVNYQLSRDGRYMLRFYRKNEYQGIVDGYIIETGLSFIITVDYNRFSQIFHNRKPRTQKAAQTQNQEKG